MTKTSSMSRRHAATHEAAHAIVAHALGVPVREAYIADPPEPHGHAIYVPGDGSALACMVIRNAGLVAEAMLGCDTSVVSLCIEDMQDVAATLEKFSPADRANVRQQVLDMTTAIVRRNWSAIVSLANELLGRQRIDGTSIAAIFEESKREIAL